MHTNFFLQKEEEEKNPPEYFEQILNVKEGKHGVQSK